MKSKEIDQLAKGPNPLERVQPPGPGERCPRCHRRIRGGIVPCLLCAPHLVPKEHGGLA